MACGTENTVYDANEKNALRNLRALDVNPLIFRLRIKEPWISLSLRMADCENSITSILRFDYVEGKKTADSGSMSVRIFHLGIFEIQDNCSSVLNFAFVPLNKSTFQQSQI